MATDYKTINSYPQGTPTASSRVPYFDSGGTIRYTQLADLQKVLPPPEPWDAIILDSVKIAYIHQERIKLAELSAYASHQSDYLGFCIPQYGRIVYPEVVSKLWGKAYKKSATTNNVDYFTNIISGEANTNEAYNADVANQGTETAIGFAHNFERFVGSHGIAKGKWWLSSPSEYTMIVAPLMNTLKYAASLFGQTWPNMFWTSSDFNQGTARTYNHDTCDIQAYEKSNAIGVLLMTNRQVVLDSH